MRIQSDQFIRWVRLRAHGDSRKLADIAKCHHNTIANAWRDRQASPHIIRCFEEFYAAREAQVSAQTSGNVTTPA